MTTPKKPDERRSTGARDPKTAAREHVDALDQIDSLDDEELARYLADRGIDAAELDASAHAMIEEAVSSRRGYFSMPLSPRGLPIDAFPGYLDPPRVPRATWVTLAGIVALVVGGIALLTGAFRGPARAEIAPPTPPTAGPPPAVPAAAVHP